MAVRRLHPEQPSSFAFSSANAAWVEATIARYPPGKEASAVIPVLWRAQEQEGWVSAPAIRAIADRLGMAYIRVLEVATFYTMFQLAPVGVRAHVQVCGTTPCMLRGAGKLVELCKSRIHHDPHHVSADGAFSWEEVECLGACVNAPMVLIGGDTYEDLTPESLEHVLESYAQGRPPAPGPQVKRQLSAPEGGETTLTDASLYDGSRVGAWRKQFEERAAATAAKAVTQAGAPPSAPVVLTPAAPTAGSAAPQAVAVVPSTPAGATAPHTGPLGEPLLLSAPRGGKSDDLTLIWGVAEKLETTMNKMGIWHFDQIAMWNDKNIAWFEGKMPGFGGRVDRDKWIEQCQKLATGWRPESHIGERPKA